MDRQLKLISALLLLLLLVAAGAVIAWQFLPATDTVPPRESVASPDSALSGQSGVIFDLRSVQRNDFNALNLPLITQGTLPVQPPPAVGKANPFL